MGKPYVARSLPAAQRRVRELEKLRDHMGELLERYAKDRRLMAKLAARTPQFDNPLVVMEAERIRDDILAGRA